MNPCSTVCLSGEAVALGDGDWSGVIHFFYHMFSPSLTDKLKIFRPASAVSI